MPISAAMPLQNCGCANEHTPSAKAREASNSVLSGGSPSSGSESATRTIMALKESAASSFWNG
jgi:hypothetical protein